MSNSIANEKSKLFALHIIELYKNLTEIKKEFILSKQILRSGTSIGANLAESRYAISKNDFLSKIYIALKEAAETRYWLELLYQSKYITENQFNLLNDKCDEIIKILTATTKTIKESN